MRRGFVIAAVVSLLASGLLTGAHAEAAPKDSGSIVGLWQRHTTCQQRVHALTRAGLEELAAASVVGQGFIPGVTDVSQLEDPSHPCKHAVAQMHYHFFTDDGLFGSLDQDFNQVDDGTYELVDGNTVVIGSFGATFHYRVLGDNILRLYPVLPAPGTDACFYLCEWMVSVSYNGIPWRPVPLG